LVVCAVRRVFDLDDIDDLSTNWFIV